MDAAELDLLALDRKAAQSAARWVTFRRRLRQGEVGDEDPFFGGTAPATRSLFLALKELEERDPIAPKLLRWVYRLTEQRINLGWLLKLADQNKTAYPVEGETTPVALKRLLTRALSEPERRQDWLRAYVAHCRDASASVGVLWQRRQEIATRMGLASPDSIELPGPGCYAAAESWLLRTAPLYEEVGVRSLGQFLSIALAEQGAQTWPRLSPEMLLGLFRRTPLFSDLELDPGPLPAPIAPASYLRALCRLGAGFVDACAPRDQFFCVAHDPYGLARYTHGACFGLLPLNGSFLRRRLERSGDAARSEQRALARSVLLHTRLAALRVLLRRAALEGTASLGERYQEFAERSLGFSLPASSAGCLIRLKVDDASRFAGLLLGALAGAKLVHAHDTDWFDNPRAADQLRSEAKLPPQTSTEETALNAGAELLGRTLSELL